jgi:hypothetical protein
MLLESSTMLLENIYSIGSFTIVTHNRQNILKVQSQTVAKIHDRSCYFPDSGLILFFRPALNKNRDISQSSRYFNRRRRIPIIKKPEMVQVTNGETFHQREIEKEREKDVE